VFNNQPHQHWPGSLEPPESRLLVYHHSEKHQKSQRLGPAGTDASFSRTLRRLSPSKTWQRAPSESSLRDGVLQVQNPLEFCKASRHAWTEGGRASGSAWRRVVSGAVCGPSLEHSWLCVHFTMSSRGFEPDGEKTSDRWLFTTSWTPRKIRM
jgi:hypothetical protein